MGFRLLVDLENWDMMLRWDGGFAGVCIHLLCT